VKRDALALLGYLTLQRLVELRVARRHTERLLAAGAYERGARHYPYMVALHTTWLATLWIYGRDARLRLAFVVPFLVLQIARYWVLRTLGERWTTRIIILPGAAPIVSGPFRFVRHPNYAVVALELPCVALALGLRAHAALFGALNLAMLTRRIRSEDAAFRELRATQPEDGILPP